MTRSADNRPLRARRITQQPDPALDPDPPVAEDLARTDALFRSFQRGARA
jgi:hypothetical protein